MGDTAGAVSPAPRCAKEGLGVARVLGPGIDHDDAQGAPVARAPLVMAGSVPWPVRWGCRVPLYPAARRLLITADCGGSNGYPVRLWCVQLQELADDLGMVIQVCDFPPGISKWNKVEHRMFCRIIQNWRGRPLVNLIGNTTTADGLCIQAQLDERDYPAGIKVSDQELAALAIERDEFHGEWNDRLKPRRPTD